VAARTCRFRAGRARPAPCQPARRIGRILKRLILLTGGNQLKLAEVFARAELKRGSCAAGRYVSDIGGLGKWERNIAGCAARAGRYCKTLVSIQLFLSPSHYCSAVWPD
jgi:hypothetical protein